MKKDVMYHFIPANFKEFNFSELLNEENNYDNEKSVIWHSSSKDCKYEHKFNVDDIVYIYYTNIPDGTKRILLRGIIKESDINKTINDELLYDNIDKIKGIKIGAIRSISLYDEEKFNLEKLKNKYNITNFRSQQYLSSDNNIDKYKKLINDIESEDNRSKLATVKKYFDEKITKCIFSEYEKNKKHETFVMENGFIYNEGHHLIRRKVIGKTKVPEKLIEDLNNRFSLCPTCHMEIHHAKREIRRKKIRKLYELRKEWYDHNITKYLDGQDILDWLYEMYDANK